MCRTAGTASGPNRSRSASIKAYQTTPSPSRLTTRNPEHSQRLRPAPRLRRRASTPSQRAMRSSGYASGFMVVSIGGEFHERAFELAHDPGPVEPVGDRARRGSQPPHALAVAGKARGEAGEFLRVTEPGKNTVRAV